MLSPSTNWMPDLAAHEVIVSDSFKKIDANRLQTTGIITPEDIELFTNVYQEGIANDEYGSETHKMLYDYDLESYLGREWNTKQWYIQQKMAHYLLLNNNTSTAALTEVINNYKDKINLLFRLLKRKQEDSQTRLEEKFQYETKVDENKKNHLYELCENPTIDYYKLWEQDTILKKLNEKVTDTDSSGNTIMDRYHVIYNRHFLKIRNPTEKYENTMNTILWLLEKEELDTAIKNLRQQDMLGTFLFTKDQEELRNMLKAALEKNFKTITTTTTVRVENEAKTTE